MSCRGPPSRTWNGSRLLFDHSVRGCASAACPTTRARQLPVIVDGATLAGFGSSTWATDAGALDVLHDLPTKDGRLSYEALRSTATTADVEGVVLHVAALPAIIASKRNAGRPKDREALPELEELERRTRPDDTAR